MENRIKNRCENVSLRVSINSGKKRKNEKQFTLSHSLLSFLRFFFQFILHFHMSDSSLSANPSNDFIAEIQTELSPISLYFNSDEIKIFQEKVIIIMARPISQVISQVLPNN